MKRGFLVAMTVAIAACADVPTTAPLLAPASPLGAVEANETTPIAFAVTNPCNGESVFLTGTQHFLFRFTESSSGVISYGFTFRQDLSGVGTFGSKYEARFSFSDRGIFKPDFPVILSFSASSDMVSTGKVGGKESNFHATSTFHITVNANGIVTVERETTSERCNG